ncbi:uncharacterized protein LOC126265693 [Aethina tumida]|uniref:uncharacterized protein LOC126265693 n=1 Tax=Aethina tumida TaxID=116153 RepID=UPI002148C58D|nr:uncharacterized protein LOC126265693 [Aethina tumida]
MPANADQHATNSAETTDDARTTRTIILPPFMESEPEFWFDMLEMRFDAAHLDDPVERFIQAFAALSPSVSLLAKDLIKPPINSESYSRLKERVVSRLTLSHEHRIRQLLETETIGDDKPSVFLWRLQSLAGPDVPEPLLRTIWESRLPSDVRMHVSMDPNVPLSKAAETGDRAFDIIKASNSRAVSASLPNSMDMMGRILERLIRVEEKLASQQINQLDVRNDLSRRRDNRRGRSRSRTRSPSRPRDANGVCWYHWKFAENARKCKQPCTYHSAGNASGTR